MACEHTFGNFKVQWGAGSIRWVARTKEEISCLRFGCYVTMFFDWCIHFQGFVHVNHRLLMKYSLQVGKEWLFTVLKISQDKTVLRLWTYNCPNSLQHCGYNQPLPTQHLPGNSFTLPTEIATASPLHTSGSTIYVPIFLCMNPAMAFLLCGQIYCFRSPLILWNGSLRDSAKFT